MVESCRHLRGIDICVDTVGDPESSAVLLIAGASASMDMWDPAFCERLADGGHFVIRYDQRDTGRSTNWPPGEPAYTGDDLTDDAIALIDDMAAGVAHVIGISAGGGVAQHIAALAPERVSSLVLISTTIAGETASAYDLPSPDPRMREMFENPPPEPDWSDRDAVIDYIVEDEHAFAAPAAFDEQQARAVAARVVDRTSVVAAMMKNHWLVSAERDQPAMSQVRAPTLILHGAQDPLFPPGHADALQAEIAGSALLVLDDVGHQPPPRTTWDRVIPAILEHTRAAERT